MVPRLCYSGGGGNKSGYNKGKHWPNRSGDCLYHLYFIKKNKSHLKQTRE